MLVSFTFFSVFCNMFSCLYLKCDTCKPEHFKLDANNPDGCTPCDCDPAGVQSGIRSCTDSTGQCTCKTLVTGRFLVNMFESSPLNNLL